MRAIATAICVAALLAFGTFAQENPPAAGVQSTQNLPEATSPDFSSVNCSGFFTDENVPSDVRLISGEESNNRIVFSAGDYVFIGKGSAQGVRVGDHYAIVRAVSDPNEVPWFKWQDKLLKAMGRRYHDAGQVEIVNVQPNVSTGIVRLACDYLQRGDIALPLVNRPAPPFKPAEQFNRFAPVSGKSVGMLVAGVDFAQAYGKNSTVFVNLGTNQGVKVGDYFRIFRYQGSHAETAPNYDDYQYSMYGFGSTPVKYQWNDLPREVLGEGVVINASHNAATMFVTYTKSEVFAGDYVEIE